MNIKIEILRRRRYTLCFFLTLMLATTSMKAQTDYSGIFYLVNCGSGKSGDPKMENITNPDDYFYLVPADNPQQDNKRDAWFSSDYSAANGDSEKPYLTTYKTKKDAADVPTGVTNRPHNSVWIVKFASTDNGTDYYYLIHAATGKYVVYDPPYSTKNNRKSVHLLSTDSPGENAKFAITTNSGNYNFRPKSLTSGNRFLNAAYQNYTSYYSSDANADTPADYFRGLVGLWEAVNDGSDWQKEATLLDAPTISAVDANGYVTIADANSLPSGYEIRYTTDGSTIPTATSTLYSGPIPITASVTIKAVVVRYGMVLTEVASEVREPVPCATPVITYDYNTSNVSITCATAGSTIYYTIDGTNPTASSTEYNSPFSVTSPTTVKAIATHTTLLTSNVAEFVVSQVATPTIQNNGSNAISIATTTPGATIYYTTDGTTPTTSSTQYTGPLTENVSNVTIKAIAVKENMLTSAVGSGSVMLQCATPVITRTGLTFTLSCSSPTDANLYYTLGGGSEEAYTGTPVSFDAALLPTTVTAVARHNDYTQSETASMLLKTGSGTSDDPYLIYGATDFATFVTNVNNGTTASACYKLGSDVSASGTDAITTEFTGVFDGGGYTISNLGNALFNSVNGGTVKNVFLDAVSISGGTNAGAIANKVTGTSSKMGSIYNCGVLAGSVSGSGYVGSIVGQLGDSNDDNCYARVINCYSYATVGGGSEVGGIVGYNDFASTAANIRTMVMNCMFYGDITSGASVSPVYGGENINNLQGGLNTFNYYAYSQLTTAAISKYNCALAVEEKYLNRFEFYRLLLNSNKKLAAFYATGSHDNANQKMMKWVLETADRTIDTPKPYPVLKAQGYYPSIINPDFENAPDSIMVGRNKGGKLGKTLSVTISSVGSNAPSGASIATSTLTLQRTDKDFDRFNFNYDKVQLPYYNDVGTGNYTGNRVVTGWKITAIDAVTGDPYTDANYNYTKTYASDQAYFDYPNYNFADRKSSNKDLYSVSGRVFSQGAYFDVPYGVTSITIEPYWGKAYYIADPNYDVVYKNDYSGKQNVTLTGTQVNNPQGSNPTQFNGQKVETSITRALDNIANNLGGLGSTVYDNALVLVGNLHLNTVPLNGDRPFTMMSVDEDNDHEPDYSLIYHHTGRSNITPIRFDFLTVPGTAQAQKPNGASLICNFTIFKTRGWFEVTNTAFMYSSQVEYENADLGGVTKIDAPLILLGGIFDQFVSTQNKDVSGKTIYIHVGSNVWINSFGLGTHSDGSQSTPHVPVSVTGGDFEEFYLTGTYNANAKVRDDNAECYISGGRFGEVAGAALEQIGNNSTSGNVHWQIYNADIQSFFGGGINDAKPVKGNITTDIFNSHVDLFCGGPKFGNMNTDKTVATTAEGCTFGKYFGAGYGGNSINSKKYYDKDGDPNWANLEGYYTTDKGKYFDGSSTGLGNNAQYGYKGPGVATDFDYEYFVWSSGKTGVRLFVKFVSFSLAQCNDVSSTLKKCTVETNFYGGGNLGKVIGTATSVLEDCTVKGCVYGAGYSASLPTVEVRNAGFTTRPNYNKQSGMFEPGAFTGTTTFTWQNAKAAGKTLSNGSLGSDSNNHILYTNTELNGLGEVAQTNLTINGNTWVGESVYGGGEEAAVKHDTHVTVNGGTIGQQLKGGYRWGNVYGGGKGKIIDAVGDTPAALNVHSVADLDAGRVEGNTNIEINGTTETTKILHNIYGGGAIGSIGTFIRDNTTGMPTSCTSGTGQTNVVVNGGEIGHNRYDTGMVNGSSRGWEGDPEGEGSFSFLNQLAWVNNTNVVIGDATTSDEDHGPSILGSVYGGGENGHNFESSVVTVNKGTVGFDYSVDHASHAWEYGNVYGSGCGTDPYTIGDDPTEYHNPVAGIVRGTTTININGGHVIRDVFGGGALGSVGSAGSVTANTNVTDAGKSTININGGVIGSEDDSSHGRVFGGPRGSLAETTYYANVRESLVNINAGSLVRGSVFGGGEAGIIREGVIVNMNGGTVMQDVYGGGALANTNVDNTAATPPSPLATTTVNLKGGTVTGNVYGGGLGRIAAGTAGQEDYVPGIEAYVYGDTQVNLNTTVETDSETHTNSYPDDCIVKGIIFGCNNLNGTPKGTVTVHVQKTQGYTGHMRTTLENLDNINEAQHHYELEAVYGGGNLAAYVPTDLVNGKTHVIIDGCGLTSIHQVYGGGNAASTPATWVEVNGTYEIEEVFGGGNGKDRITINGVERDNPGANVGFYEYEDDVEGLSDTPENRAANYGYGSGSASVDIYGGRIHRVYGGSNTKGNVRQIAVTMLEDAGGCEFIVDEAYGGGKSANMDGESRLDMACIPGLKNAYGGAENADIHNDVTLNITNGNFDRVFGGNNVSGTINGTITVNIEETGCHLITIGQLYGGGNQAPYTGPLKAGSTTERQGPTLNLRSFTSIGDVYGGGYGVSAKVTGDTYVNINVCEGEDFGTNQAAEVARANTHTGNRTLSFSEFRRTENGGFVEDENGRIIDDKTCSIYLPPFTSGIGAINNVYGGGNAAEVIGNTHVNIGTAVGDDIVFETPTSETNPANRTHTVVGANIIGNVYGGGNEAAVTGNTNVLIGKKVE